MRRHRAPASHRRRRAARGSISPALSKDASVRRAAVRALAALAGAGAVDALIYAMQEDDDYGVRRTATELLAALGPAARKAVPHIEGILRQPRYEPPPIATPEQIQHGFDDDAYRKALEAALLHMKGPGPRVSTR